MRRPIQASALVALVGDDRRDVPHAGWRLGAELLHARTGGVDVFSTHLAPPPQQAALRLRQVAQIDVRVVAGC